MNKMRISPKRQNKKNQILELKNTIIEKGKKLTTTGNLIREKKDLEELLILSSQR